MVKNGVQEDKRKFNGKISTFEKVENELYQSLIIKREKGSALTARVIYKDMKALLMNHYSLTNKEYQMLQNFARYCSKNNKKCNAILFLKSNEECKSFNAKDEEINLTNEEAIQLRDAFLKSDQKLIIINKDWLSRFSSKFDLTYRKITHLCRKTPDELEKDVLRFLSEIHKLRKDLDIPSEMIFNFDEVAVFYDQIPSYTYEKKGSAHPLLKVSQLHKKRLTVGLTISSSGEKLKPLLIFKGAGVRINKLNNYHNYFVKKNQNAWNTNQIFLEYIERVIKPYIMDLKVKTEFKTKKALLVIDNFAGHKFEEQKLAEFEQQGLIIKYLRPYTTSICQPLDLNINFLLKSSLKDQWIDWIDQHPNINPTKQTIYNWLVQAWKKITPINIIKTFLMSEFPMILTDLQTFYAQISKN